MRAARNYEQNRMVADQWTPLFVRLREIISSGAELQLYSVNNITSGTDSQGEVTVRLQKSGRIVNGNGSDIDIVTASAKAYLSALNKLHSKLEKAHPQI